MSGFGNAIGVMGVGGVYGCAVAARAPVGARRPMGNAGSPSIADSRRATGSLRTMAWKFTAEQMIAALEHTKGMRFLAARHLGCSYDTLMRYIHRYPSVKAVAESFHGELVDIAELKLWQSIQNGEPWGITLALKTLGKSRGYVERTEVTGQDGGPIPLTLEVRLAQAITQLDQARLNGHNGATPALCPPDAPRDAAADD